MKSPTLREIAQRQLSSHEPIDWSGCLSVVSGSLQGGISPEVVIEQYAGGAEIDELSHAFDIPDENILDVLVYVAQCVQDRESPPVVRIDWRGCDAVERVLGRMSGIPVLKKSRMSADSVVENFIYGSSLDEIAENFSLDRDAVEAVIAFALRSSLHVPARDRLDIAS